MRDQTGADRRHPAGARAGTGASSSEEAGTQWSPSAGVDLDAGPKILERPDHSLSRGDLSPETLKVLYRLHKSGYQAFLVGGGVRDLLLGLRPKDFDVATNARPQEIRRLFRNSRTIGRRFRLVHVFFRGEIVEVATFRASPGLPDSPEDWEESIEEVEEDEEETAGPVPPAGRHEAVFGTPAEDARRRDFTVNALFYNIADFSIIDYVGGISDLKARVIRTIGDPEQRFEEDPVRMMRALEYKVRLGFDIDSQTTEAISRQCRLISEASAPRLTYELLETLRSGKAAGIFEAWRQAGLVEYAFPDLPHDSAGVTIAGVLEKVDGSIISGRTLATPSLLGGFYLARFFDLVGENTAHDGRIDNAGLLDALRDLVAPAGASMHLPNQTMHLIQQGLFTLTKMRKVPERGRQVLKLARQDYFPVAWELHGLAAALGLVSPDIHEGWRKALNRIGRKDRAEDSRTEGEVRRRPGHRRRPRGRRRR